MAKYNLSIDGVSVEAVFNKLGGVEGAKRFLRGELAVYEVVRPWYEDDGTIHFIVTTDGTDGEAWIKRLEDGHHSISDDARKVLLSPSFRVTKDVTTGIVVMKGNLFSDQDRTMQNIHAEAIKRGYLAPNPEVACLIREKFSDHLIGQKMGLWGITVMHEPVDGSAGLLHRLYVHYDDDGSWLDTYSHERWHEDEGFAFFVPANLA